MGYTIAKSITINKQSIKINGASSNTFDIMPSGRMRRCSEIVTIPNNQDNLRMIYDELQNGLIQPTPSANGYKWAYMLHTCHTFEDFLNFINQEQPTKKCVIRSIFPHFGYFAKRGRCFVCTPSRNNATPMGYYEAHVIFERYKGANQITIEAA